MLRGIEQKVCDKSYMHQNEKIIIRDWYVKIDPPMWMAANFACMNVLINDNDDDNDNVNDNNHVIDKLFVNKLVGIGFNIVKNPDYENLKLEKDGYIKFFGEVCVEWFLNEMLEKKGYLKNYFKNELENTLDTIPKKYDQTTGWLCEKELNLEGVKENTVVKDPCHLTGKFRDLAHNICNLNTPKAIHQVNHTSFVPKLFHIFSGYDCHLIFEKIANMATEKNIKINENDIMAKSSGY